MTTALALFAFLVVAALVLLGWAGLMAVALLWLRGRGLVNNQSRDARAIPQDPPPARGRTEAGVLRDASAAMSLLDPVRPPFFTDEREGR